MSYFLYLDNVYVSVKLSLFQKNAIVKMGALVPSY